MYSILKNIHVVTAALTICGFVLRGIWMLSDSPNLHRRAVRIVPHVVDSVFLLSGIALIVELRLAVLTQPWLIAKLCAIVAYILLGMIALRRGRSQRTRAVAFALALAVFAWIVGVALSKSTWSWVAYLAN